VSQSSDDDEVTGINEVDDLPAEELAAEEVAADDLPGEELAADDPPAEAVAAGGLPSDELAAHELAADDAGNLAAGGTARGVLDYMARQIVDEPDAVVIELDQRGTNRVDLRLHVAPDDMGKIIGRRGRVAQAIRTVVRAAGAREGVETTVDIVD
jgi:uncharacterized protein